ncbi:sensor histidine kinase [Amycolatopsis anabasis]|uniref:sensor histidine kinase n=1 Tax=Amycolatopsis anabasis TaxID=1840409 RepID=UPI001FE6E8B7|nr:histidine kinase [Amycolatopsis anabasis]
MDGERLIDKGAWWSDDTSAEPSGPARSPVRWAVVGTVIMLPIIVPLVRHALRDEAPLVWRVLALAVLAVFTACFLTYPVVLGKRTIRVRVLFCVGMILLGWALIAVIGFETMYVLLYAIVVISMGLPPGWVLVLNGASLSAAAVLALLAPDWLRWDLGEVGTVFGISSAMFFMGRLIRAVRGLRAANEEIGTLAATAERERLARDLHDILGHSLTTITVKAGVTRRVLETSGDQGRAIAELRELEGLARSALSDVRATVSEYREVSLSGELVGARAALRAAEIGADLPHAVDNVRPELQGVFGYVLREAVTNVLRHSGAGQVKVRFGRNWMEIEDNGSATAPVTAGNGLRGLRERLDQVGGTLTAEPRPGGGLLVRAEVTERPAEISGAPA